MHVFGKKAEDVTIVDWKAPSTDVVHADASSDMLNLRSNRSLEPVQGFPYVFPGHETVVVNPFAGKNSEQHRYYKLARDAARINGTVPRHRTLPATYDVVRNMMEYSQDGVNEVLKERFGTHEPQEIAGLPISLDDFLAAGVGVSRHFTLAAAAIMNSFKFKTQRNVTGTLSIERNSNWDPLDEGAGGHMWLRYITGHEGVVMVVDPVVGRTPKGDLRGYCAPLYKIPRQDAFHYTHPDEQSQAYVEQLEQPAAQTIGQLGRSALQPSIINPVGRQI